MADGATFGDDGAMPCLPSTDNGSILWSCCHLTFRFWVCDAAGTCSPDAPSCATLYIIHRNFILFFIYLFYFLYWLSSSNHFENHFSDPSFFLFLFLFFFFLPESFGFVDEGSFLDFRQHFPLGTYCNERVEEKKKKKFVDGVTTILMV